MAIALADLIDPKQITLRLRATNQAEAMREIVDLLVAGGKVDNAEKFLEQLQELASRQRPWRSLPGQASDRILFFSSLDS